MLTLLALIAAVQQDPGLAARTHNLMPVPRAVQWTGGRLAIDSTFTLGSSGFWDARLDRAIRRTTIRLRGRSRLAIAIDPQNDRPASLIIRVRAAGQAVQGVTEDESYTLDVSPAGAVLDAPTVVGAMRGLETFLQLTGSDGGGFYAETAHIEDAPRFPWRGLLVDAGRHFMPPEVIRRTLDGMAAVKLNVLHWHLSEDQGFRVESRRYPRLHQMGSDGLYYTQDQIRELVAYARDRGIRVVPEFDMPGHSQSWLVGYPELSAGQGPFTIERAFGVFDPVLDPTRDEVYRFLDGFIGEMAGLFPDAYFHIGGDEVNGVQWNANPRITAFKQAHGLADNEALHVYFNQRVLRILTKYHKQMIGWDEILQPGLPTSAVIQSWRGAESLSRGAKAGYGGILSAPFYLDHQNTAEAHYLAEILPANTDLTAEEQARVYGGEACMWAEHVTSETVDSRIWPRMAAIAERLWSPREVRDVPDMYRRLALTSLRLEELGLTHIWHTDRMLRRLVPNGSRGLGSLLFWAGTPSFGQRGQLQHPNQLTPLTGLVDAARPDPPGRWVMLDLVARAQSGDTTTYARMRGVFDAWRGLPPLVAGDSSPAGLAQGSMLAALALQRAAAIGAEALDTLRTGRRAGAAWTAAQLALITPLEQPQGLLRLSLLDQLEKLVKLAGNGQP